MPVKPNDLDTAVRQLADFVDAITDEVARQGDRLQALADLAYDSHRRSPAAEAMRDVLLAELGSTDALAAAGGALRATLYGLTGAGAVPPNPQRRPPAAPRVRHRTEPGDPPR